MLLSNEPFQYAHLIKFERPSRPDSTLGLVSTSKERYTYITDASRDVSFDDGSLNLVGAPNGPQNYVANKVLKLSSVSEDTEAKASAYSLVLDGNGLGALISNQSVTISSVTTGVWDLTFPSSIDLLRYGFREGDKITLSGAFTGTVNISKFRAANVIRVTKIDDTLSVGTGITTVSMTSDEIVSILLDKNSTSYSSFINREVFIYRAYFQDGTMLGTPFLLFKGIISGVGFDDDDALTVTWNLTSHWGDFSQVKGRITSDDFHRALDQNGVPQPNSALKIAYAYDKGFTHSETSINILAQYSVQVEKQDVSVKKGFLGIGSKVKVKKYFVTETRNTELDFQLQAKAIPIIYGVRNTSGVPVFADTLNDDSSTVYVVQALSEGEIGGIYDAYVDGNSLICNNKADFDARSTQTDDDTVQLICRGRADRGDVLGGASSVATTTVPFYDYYYSRPDLAYKATNYYDYNWLYNYNPYVAPPVNNAATDNTGAGVYDGQSINLTSPQEITLDVFSGKPGQKAASSLVDISKANNFKIQNDYWNGIDTADYWGPNHRLLDTAYVVGKFKIKEGETTIPEIEYIVRGKSIDCYNYDKSYSHYSKATTESADNFKLGQYVSLQKMDGTVLASNVQIIDKWSFAQPDGTLNTRFRFSIDPPLSYVDGVPQITQFKMVSGSNTWTMITYNFNEISGSITNEWITTITAASNSGGYVQFTLQNATSSSGDPEEPSCVFSVSDSTGRPISDTFFGGAVIVGTVSGNTLTTKYSWDAAGANAQAMVGKNMVRRNIVTLPSSASTTSGAYNGYDVTLTRIDPVTGRLTRQKKSVIDYAGSSKIATIDGLWDYGFHPKAGDSISLTPAYADSRVSINPVMQLMDYITSVTYGRGLDPNKDLNFQSWLDSAKICDKQSNVTVLQSNPPGATYAGTIYKYPSAGDVIWQGTVVGNSAYNYVEFTNVIGKLTNAWNNWRTFQVGQLVYADNNLYKVSVAGIKTSKPIHTSGSIDGLDYMAAGSVQLTKVGTGSGATTLNLVVDGNPVRAQKNGVTVPGYSLYDSDGVDYWRLLGWDQFDQRFVTQHQTNMIVDTSLPLFDNVNSFLQHFGGIMRYSGGQYYLDVEQPDTGVANSSSDARNITADHIIGKLKLTDEGIRSAFNSLTASYADPSNKFESRNISFFNSEYLKADRGVPKKGTLTLPGITNYYNSRLLADRFLNKSRFGLTIAFNMAPRGILLLAGGVIQLQYPRYNWVNKKFRIITLTHQTDATVDIVAEEYDPSFYTLSNISRQAAAGKAGNYGSVSGISSPTDLKASSVSNGDEITNAVELTWTNNISPNSTNVYTEVYSSYSNFLYVDVNNITGNVITTVQNPHKLRVGELITAMTSSNGLLKDKAYFIQSTPAPNKIVLSEVKGGPVLPLVNGTGLDILLQTATVIGSVPVPANTYIDSFGGIDGRVSKFYWVRYRVY